MRDPQRCAWRNADCKIHMQYKKITIKILDKPVVFRHSFYELYHQDLKRFIEQGTW